jgi:serine/threonine protein kinase/tetratricopeptide (TPR) repeat protein
VNRLLDELLNAQNESWHHQEPCTLEQLLDDRSVPIESLSSSDLLDLICNEARLRELAGQAPTLDEYQQRFPRIRDELANQWQINLLLDTHSQQLKARQADAPLDGFGRYEIYREVGRGAMGIVYEAYDRQLRRIVAIKCLRSEFGRESIEFERFENEAESIGKLHHPNLVQVYDFGFNNDVPFIVMEYCSGGTLAERLVKPMAASEAVEWMISIASAVGVAHAAGIIHRDLKPANILLHESDQLPPQVKVSDFGLAKSLDVGTSATLTGSILGSPAYMPPEQAAGKRELIGPASDVYALGAILFQCLTARPPFVGDSIADVLYQVQYDDPLRIRQLNPRTPRALETIVAKCLSKNPSGRYSDAKELAEDLTRYRSGLAIRARPERWDQKFRRIARRHRMSTVLISTSLLLLLGLVVSSMIYSARLRVALKESETAAKLALLEKADGLLAKANGLRMSNRPGRRLIAQDILREAIQMGRDLQQPDAWFGPYRDEFIETTWLTDLCVREWRTFSDEVRCADFSPSGRLACMVYANGGLEVREWDSDTVLAKGTLPKAMHIAFLDERRFLNVADDSVTCFRLSDGSIQLEWVAPYSAEFKGGYWLDRERQRLLVLVTDNLLLIDLESGTVISEISDHGFKPSIDIAIHPVEDIYLINCYDTSVFEIRDLDSHEVLYREHFSGFNGANGGAWSPDGSKFVLLEGDGKWAKVYGWDETHQSAKLLETIDHAKSLAGNPPGVGMHARVRWPATNQLLTHNSIAKWVIYNASITRTTISTPTLSSLTNFSNLPNLFPQDRMRIAMIGSQMHGSKSTGPLEIALGNEQKQLISRAFDPFHHLAISHDGRFAVCFENGRLNVFDLANGNEIGRIELDIVATVSIALDVENNLYLATPDHATVFQLAIIENRMVLKSAKRIPVPATGHCLCPSTNGSTLIAGAWASFHSADYAGVWVKTTNEPFCRKIIQGQSARNSSTGPNGKDFLVSSGYLLYRVDLSNLDARSLGPIGFEQAIQYSPSGDHAIAGGKLYRTNDWQAVPLSNNDADETTASRFSNDGSQLIFDSKDQRSELRTSFDQDEYLKMEGRVLHYDSRHGVMLCLQDDGLYFRNLRLSAEQLNRIGLNWKGPTFEEMKPLGLHSVELSPELANLKGYSQWMDYLDEQALNEAAIRLDDGHAQFMAAMVYIERCEYEQALALLRRSNQLLPSALTPFQWQAYVLAAQKRWQEAIEAATRFIDATNDGEMRLHRAAWYLDVDQPHQAISDADQVIAENPNYYFPRRARAIKLLAYEQLGDVTNANKVQDEISRDRPNDDSYASSLEPMVTAEISLRHTRLAACYSRQILAPTSPEFAISLAWSSVRNGEYEAALQILDAASEARQTPLDDPDRAHVLAIRAMCSAHLGNLDLANEYFAKLTAMLPERITAEWYSHSREIRILTAEIRRLLR